MNNLRLIFYILLFFAAAGSAYEIRIWEDVTGSQYKGRFLRELFDKLTIETEDGGLKAFELKDLSELDQRYLRVMVPPKVEAEVISRSADVEPLPMALPRDDFSKKHQVTVHIEKKSQRPFTSRLRAEIFLIAEEVEGSNYILLDMTQKEFLLPTIQKGASVELKSNTVQTREFRDVISSEMKGEKYDGYLLVVSSLQGETVLVESNLPPWIEDPEVIRNLRELFITGAASVRSRHFDKTGKKVPPARPEHRSPATT